ncbi:hypothetical protein ILUMI_12259 [Ignelater luminosus]|uniref:Reverse transcriptase domain-containing protein n=1 Tax=Ignelater luminosus TaxID=2038154 RepID=A0A8K0CYI4_IGNLU|nr:hypothetical protein ILUMI_12259 [Ignelater luminosus]
MALVHPLPKVNQPDEFKDLRPISILPTLSKVIEKIMSFQIIAHLSDLLPPTQSGFRTGYSCPSALTNIVDDIVLAVDNNKLTALVMLDYSKAFDKINHKVLISITHYLGFGSNAMNLLKSYLEQRIQRVTLANASFDSCVIGSGVPQGFILGPLLFSIYISELATSVKFCNIHFYADDTQIYYSFHPKDIDTANANINSDLNNLIELSDKHPLSINPIQSSLILFGNAQICDTITYRIKININNVSLPVNIEAKNLGVTLDAHLKFKMHVNSLIQKAYTKLKYLFFNRFVLSNKSRVMLCEALVLSQFNYCDVVYGPCLEQKDRLRIQRVQNSCLKFIYGKRERDLQQVNNF